MRLKTIIGMAMGLVIATAALAADITGAGATFPYPLYTKWADDYKAKTGIGLNYQSIGSGAGIKQIKAKTVTFGATDKPLTETELNEAGLVQWPQIIGGIVPIVNIKGVAPGQLVLSGDVIAKIYLKQIVTWDDPAIKALNPGVALPHQAISPVYRSDGSGTTYNFTDYLGKVNSDWNKFVGTNTNVEWAAGIGAKGNDGVSSVVKMTDGSIGYVEYAYAKQNSLTHTRMINKEGKTVSPEIKTFQAAAANADWAGTPGFAVILTNQSGADAWPITAASFILVYKVPQDKAATSAVIDFFRYSFANGDASAEQLDYVPLPDSVVALVEKLWATIALK